MGQEAAPIAGSRGEPLAGVSLLGQRAVVEEGASLGSRGNLPNGVQGRTQPTWGLGGRALLRGQEAAPLAGSRGRASCWVPRSW
nr:hypothetical protein [Tanacetum cinerariifolium]